MASAVKAVTKPRLLVLGTGWGGTSLLRALRDPHKWNITIGSSRDHMLFTPLLTATATGALEHRSILEPIRPLATAKNATFLNAIATSVNSARGVVRFSVPPAFNVGRGAGSDSISAMAMTEAANIPADGMGKKDGVAGNPGGDMKLRAMQTFEQSYDVLVTAVGATVNTFNVPGVSEHALYMKEAADARRVRRRMHDCFEAASLPVTTRHARHALLTFVVCGAGPTGVELAAEMSDWLRDVARSRRFSPRLAEDARVVLVEASGDILSTFDTSLRAYALSRLRAARVDVRLGAAVRRVEGGAVVLADAAERTSGDALLEERLPCGMLVWTAGVGPRRVVAASDLPLASPGNAHIAVDAHLLADLPPATKPVFAIGDCARITGQPLVPIAQVAEQQGVYLAQLLDALQIQDLPESTPSAEALRKVSPPFRFASRGMLAYVGGWRGVAAVAMGTGAAEKHDLVKSSGFVAWLIWRFAYFSKLGSPRNKLQVPLDWFKTLLFGRDVSSF